VSVNSEATLVFPVSEVLAVSTRLPVEFEGIMLVFDSDPVVSIPAVLVLVSWVPEIGSLLGLVALSVFNEMTGCDVKVEDPTMGAEDNFEVTRD
jgi:hypothetical protein